MANISQTYSIRLDLPHFGKTTLPIFRRATSNEEKPSRAKSSVIFGRNGSGKSSIGRALASTELEVEFLGHKDDVIDDSSDRSNIYVFNEDYIDTNFRQRITPHLVPIILLGASVQNLEKEEKLTFDLKINQGKLAKREEKLETANDAKIKALNNIKAAIRGDAKTKAASWKGRSRFYHTDGQLKKVTQGTIDRIIELARTLESAPEEPNDIEKQFNEGVSILQAANSTEPIRWDPPRAVVPPELARIRELFTQVSQAHANSSSQSGSLVDKIRNLGASASELRLRAEKLFGDGDTSCPTCLQSIPHEFSIIAREAIDSYLTELEANSSLSELKTYRLSVPSGFRAPEYVIDGEDELRDFLAAAEEIAEITKEVNIAISTKVENPAGHIELNDSALVQAYIRFSKATDGLAMAIKKHNEACRQSDELYKQVERINDKLAAHEISDWVKLLEEKEVEATELKSSVASIKADLSSLEDQLHALQDERKSETRAANAINHLLRKVFGPSGMSLEARDEGYAVVNRGSDVSPSYLSTGERNILSLCYFLIGISSDAEFDSSFMRDQLIVLDDPVSSFDHDNRYGVLTLLNWLGWRISAKGSKTSIAIFTHDPGIAYELSKGLSSATNNHLDWQLRNGQLSKSSHDYVDHYLQGLTKMSAIALAAEDSEELTSALSSFHPNEMRRVWEAFVSFELGENVTDVTRAPKVQAYFESMGERHANFLATYPGRVFVHADSHSANQVRFEDFKLSWSLSENDYRRFAREMICFMHLIAPHHIPSRLATSRTSVETHRANLETLVNEVLMHCNDHTL